MSTEQWWSDDTVLRVAKALALSDLSSTAIPFGELSSRAQAAHLNAARVALAAVSSLQGVSCFLCGAGPNPDAVVWHSVFPGMVICRGCRDAKDMAANRPTEPEERPPMADAPWYGEEAVEVVRQAMGWDQSLGKTYACKAILNALTPHVEAYTKDARTFTSQFLREMRQAQRAEAFEACKRIVSGLYKNPKRYESQYDEGFDYAIDLAEQALDRASTTTPEAT